MVSVAAGVGEWLGERGVGQGDRVVLWGPNQPAWAGAYFGCLLAGAVLVPLDARTAPDFVAKVVEKTRPRLQLVGPTQEPSPTAPAVRFADLPPLDRSLPPSLPVPTEDDLAEIFDQVVGEAEAVRRLEREKRTIPPRGVPAPRERH